ncbi:MAG: hypothetical protein Kow00121_61830 [Elainellaceae cyanobacterium]
MPKRSPQKPFQAIDRVAFTLIGILTLAIALLLVQGDRVSARVRDFSWQGRQVGAEDAAFLLTFSRPMDHTSVEENLQIQPPLPGKFSWAGRRMAYTLEAPAPYGQSFQITLENARDRFSAASGSRTQIQPFTGQFRTRNRAFVYLGVEGEEAGRLVLQDLTQQQQKILTPENLVVMDFKPYPEGDRILFSAVERSSQSQRGLADQQLYTVTTGIQIEAPASLPGQEQPRASAPSSPQPAGMTELLLDNANYQNLKFDLSPNGQIIVVQRVNKQNPSDFGLWLLQDGQPPQPIETEPGGDFRIAPDSQSIAMSQGQGMAILPLESGADPLDFLPSYGVLLSFAQDGTAAAMVQFNRDPDNPTRSLFLVTNQGTEKELLKTDGSILDAVFDPTQQNLYCLITRRLPTDIYSEQPYLTAIHLETGEQVDLLQLPVQQDIQISLAPDGLGILFDQIVSDSTGTRQGVIRGRDGKTITASRLWFLPLEVDTDGTPRQAQPQALDLPGLRPRWLP